MPGYEIVLVVRAELADEEARLVVERVTDWLGKREGKIIKLENWGRRRLAYPIDHLNEGNYFYAQFEAPPASIKGFEKHLNLQKEIIRYLVVKLSNKKRVLKEKV